MIRSHVEKSSKAKVGSRDQAARMTQLIRQ